MVIACTIAVVMGAATPLTIVSPADGAQVPPDLSGVTFLWSGGPEAKEWRLTVGEAVSRSQGARRIVVPASELWSGAKPDDSPELTARVCALDARGAEVECSAPARLRRSPFALDETVASRLVDYRFDAAQTTVIRETGNAGAHSWSAREVCVGCHAYSRHSGTGKVQVALNVRRGPQRRLVILEERPDGPILTQRRNLGEFSFLAWSPAGDKLALVVNTFGTIDKRDDDVEPFDLVYRSGDLALYDPASRVVALVPGASELGFVEDMPAFSPDGRELVFVRYEAIRAEPIARMSLYRIALSGPSAGKARPLLEAKPGEFDYLPQYSPDGRWISFVRGDGSHGVFARQTSDIWIVAAGGGAARRLALSAEGTMDSWHRWARNGRWLLFSTKRGGVETALWVSAIDTEGNASPPLELFRADGKKVNLPVPRPPPVAAVVGEPDLSDLLRGVFE